MRNRKRRKVVEDKFCDWDPEELNACLRHKLAYTVRSSKFPRYGVPSLPPFPGLGLAIASFPPHSSPRCNTTVPPSAWLTSFYSTKNHPARVTIIVNDTHHFNVHKILLKSFSSKLAAQLKANPTVKYLRIRGDPPIGSLPAWLIYTEWLYMFDKVPLPDFTPLRLPHWTTSAIKSACFLASFLGATKFEKYLLRIIFKETWDGDFSESDLYHLSQRMGKKTGMWHFSNAYMKWKGSGYVGELDPYRWRVEHWYSICGTLANWGCFHAMNTSGWGGVWERQRLLAEKQRIADIVTSHDDEEVIYDSDGRIIEDERYAGRTRPGRERRAHVGGGDGACDYVDYSNWQGRNMIGYGGVAGGLAGGAAGFGAGAVGWGELENSANEETASGEEMWEEWWEDDDLYSRLDSVVDLAIEDVADDGLAGFEGELENDPDFNEVDD